MLVKGDAAVIDDLKKKDAEEEDGPEAGDLVKNDGDKVEFTVCLLIRLVQ